MIARQRGLVFTEANDRAAARSGLIEASAAWRAGLAAVPICCELGP